MLSLKSIVYFVIIQVYKGIKAYLNGVINICHTFQSFALGFLWSNCFVPSYL